jgi:hypothetical protein
MNTANLNKKLIAAARHHGTSDRVPYAFEKRIMAHIKDLRPVDVWALWGRALWRAAAPCVAITLIVGVWSFQSQDSEVAQLKSADLEMTVLAPMDNLGDVW